MAPLLRPYAQLDIIVPIRQHKSCALLDITAQQAPLNRQHASAHTIVRLARLLRTPHVQQARFAPTQDPSPPAARARTVQWAQQQQPTAPPVLIVQTQPPSWRVEPYRLFAKTWQWGALSAQTSLDITCTSSSPMAQSTSQVPSRGTCW